MSMDEDDDMNDAPSGVEGVIPYVRIYLSFGKQNHDMLELPEVMSLLTQDGSPTEKVKEFLDQGMVNVYACTFNNVVKIL